MRAGGLRQRLLARANGLGGPSRTGASSLPTQKLPALSMYKPHHSAAKRVSRFGFSCLVSLLQSLGLSRRLRITIFRYRKPSVHVTQNPADRLAPSPDALVTARRPLRSLTYAERTLARRKPWPPRVLLLPPPAPAVWACCCRAGSRAMTPPPTCPAAPTTAWYGRPPRTTLLATHPARRRSGMPCPHPT